MIGVVMLSLFSTTAYIIDALKMHNEREKEYKETVKELKRDNELEMEILERKIYRLEENSKNEKFNEEAKEKTK
jgi:hypothetical protein